MTEELIGVALAAFALVLFSSNIILTRVALARLDLNVGFLIMMTVNLLVSAVVLALQAAWRGHGPGFDRLAFAQFALAGVSSTFLGRWFFYESVARLGAAKASTFQVASPMFAALIAWLFLHESLNSPAWAGMAIATAGLLAVALVPAAKTQSTSPAPGSRSGAHLSPLRAALVLGVGAPLAYAIGNVLRAAAIRRWPEAIVGGLIGAAAGVALQFTLHPRSLGHLWNARNANRVGVGLYALGGVITIVAQVATIASMAYVPVAISALITLCTPLLVFPLSLVFLRKYEAPTWRTFAGCLVALGGIALLIANST